MHKFYIELAAGLLAVVAGIYATKNAITIEWLGRGFITVAGVYATKSETIAWLRLGFASVLLGLALHGWMKDSGHQKWKRLAWPVVLTFVLLLSSWSIIGRPSSPKVDTLQSEENRGQMLAGARLKKAKLNGANLRMAMLAGADLREADLENTDLHRAMLLGANLSGANLVNANFEDAMLMGAQLEGARIDGTNFANAAFLTQDQVDEACGKPRALPEGLRAPKRC